MSVWRDARKLMAGWRWRAGYLLGTRIPAEYEDELVDIIKRVRRHTLTTAPRIAALVDATAYVARNGIPGAIVECGVWRGGSVMACALTLLRHAERDRDLYLFDTFTGMVAPTPVDVRSPYDGYSPQRRWRRFHASGRQWAGVPASEVRANVEGTGYPRERIHLVEGRVEETVPVAAPEAIALLRLDTDWYASTRHELEQLYPRLVPGGVLILDDYGHYAGARRAVDEYFGSIGDAPLLHRVDYTGRMATKPGATAPVHAHDLEAQPRPA
jgi:O-methyltransferase